MKLYIGNIDEIINNGKYRPFLKSAEKDDYVKNKWSKNNKRNKEIIASYILIRSFVSKDNKILFTDMKKPYISGFSNFNISHSDDMICLCTDEDYIGVDLQKISEYRKRAARAIFSEEEIKYIENAENKDGIFTLLWTIKEAYGKKLGDGLGKHLKKTNFLSIIEKTEQICFEHNGSVLVCSYNNYYFYISKIKNYYITVCSDKKDKLEIIYL
ncbi:MAG: 4'-phosphopantetheinyl transferase superfamily protein [Clostridia bacterium]|nr:4'-phosphopantetheinyl transferase superfamily protein [Clostridia bacterium]